MLAEGDKVHVVIRRMFENDIRRHFFGEISTVPPHHLQVEGYPFHHDTTRGEFIKAKHKCERIVSLTDGEVIITLLPDDADLTAAKYGFSGNQTLVLTDGPNFQMDINEFGAHY